MECTSLTCLIILQKKKKKEWENEAKTKTG